MQLATEASKVFKKQLRIVQGSGMVRVCQGAWQIAHVSRWQGNHGSSWDRQCRKKRSSAVILLPLFVGVC